MAQCDHQALMHESVEEGKLLREGVVYFLLVSHLNKNKKIH